MKVKNIDAEYFPNYVVLVERLKNGTNGDPRWKTVVVPSAAPKVTNSAQVTSFSFSSYNTHRGVAEEAIEKYTKALEK